MSAASVGVDLQALPVDLTVELAERAERSGFASVWFSAPAYEQSIAAAGFADERRAIQERVDAGDLAGAMRAVPDAMADALTISGSPAHARERIDAYHKAGIRTVVLNPSPPGGLFPLYEGQFPADAALPDVPFDAYVDVVDRTIATLGAAA